MEMSVHINFLDGVIGLCGLSHARRFRLQGRVCGGAGGAAVLGDDGKGNLGGLLVVL